MLLVIVELLALKIWVATPPFVAPILADGSIWHLGSSITVPSGYVWLLLIAVAFTAVLTILWRYTRIGWYDVRGVRPPARRRGSWNCTGVRLSATWVAGSALAGVAGILFTPTTRRLPPLG